MAKGTSRRLQIARYAVGGLTGLLLLVALGNFAMGDVDRTFSDLGMAATALLAALSCGLAARLASGRLRLAWRWLAVAALSWGFAQTRTSPHR